MRTVFVIACGVALGLVLVKISERVIVDPWLNRIAPGDPKTGAADLSMEDRKAVKTELI